VCHQAGIIVANLAVVAGWSPVGKCGIAAPTSTGLSSRLPRHAAVIRLYGLAEPDGHGAHEPVPHAASPPLLSGVGGCGRLRLATSQGIPRVAVGPSERMSTSAVSPTSYESEEADTRGGTVTSAEETDQAVRLTVIRRRPTSMSSRDLDANTPDPALGACGGHPVRTFD
jgi:hypothetical protein